VTGPAPTPADRGAEGAYTAYSYLAAGEDFRRFGPLSGGTSTGPCRPSGSAP